MESHDDLRDRLLGAWRTESVGGEPLPQGVTSEVRFTDDGRIEGYGGVNRFGGPVEIGNDVIEFGALFSTLMAGPEPASRHERQLLQAFGGRRAAVLEGDTLVIGSGDDEVRLQRAGQPAAAASDELEISGSVLYRQRIALPPGAELTVRLSDVSLAGAPAVTLAEQVIPVEHQVPIPFTLHVDRAALDERHTYALSARITIDGELRWISDTHIPVRLPGPTTGMDVLVVPVG
jgi:putative lipoprotein